MRNSSSLDWLRFMHTPNDYRVSQIQLPQNQWTGFSYYTNLFKYSDRYHIYSLGHILI